MNAKDVRKKFLFGLGKKKEQQEEKKEDWQLTTNNMELFDDDKKADEPLIDKSKFEEKIAKNNYGDRTNMNTGAYVNLADDIQEKIGEEKAEQIHEVPQYEEVHEIEEVEGVKRKPVESINPYASDYMESVETKSEPVQEVEQKVEEPVISNNTQFKNESRKVNNNLFVNEADASIEPERNVEKTMETSVYNDYANPTEFAVEHKPVESAVSSTTLVGSQLVKNAKAVSPLELELPSDLKVQEVTFSFIDCVPLRVEKVEDTEGNLSRKLEQLEDKYSISVLPLDLCGIPDNVVSLKKHRILNINGRKFADGTTRIVNHEAYSSLIGLARDCISRAIEFKVNITREQHTGNYSFVAPMLNTYELTKFISECKNYSPKVYTVSNGDIYIELGALRAKI